MKPGDIVEIHGPNRRYAQFGRIEGIHTFNAETGPVCDLRKMNLDEFVVDLFKPTGVMVYMVPAFDLRLARGV